MDDGLGRTIVVVTHDPQILPLADVVVYMSGGRVTSIRAQTAPDARGGEEGQCGWREYEAHTIAAPFYA